MRLWPRSIRARGTLMATALSAVLVLLLNIAAGWALERQVRNDAGEDARTAAVRVAAQTRGGSLGATIEPDIHAPLIQVVDQNGRVAAATPAARGLPPLVVNRPPPGDWEKADSRCVRGTCYEIRAVRTTGDPDSSFVVAAAPLPDLLTSGIGELIQVLVLLLIVGLIAALTWTLLGRALRPVEELRAQYEEISTGDLSRRIPESRKKDEISRLVQTINRTLDRMEQTLERQRQFASDASHELRTPIAGLRANLEDALLHPDDTDFHEVAEASLRATDRLEAIVNDLLLLARVGSGRESSEHIDLGALLRDEAEADVRTEIEPGLRVYGAKAQLSRLFGNLLDNAHRYGGGEIRLTARREGDRARVEVTDEGPGIPAAERERVFGRFTRIDTARSRGAGGTGLGLAIAREVALAHGGSVRVEDSARGARFVVLLPLEPSREEDEGQEPTAKR